MARAKNKSRLSFIEGGKSTPRESQQEKDEQKAPPLWQQLVNEGLKIGKEVDARNRRRTIKPIENLKTPTAGTLYREVEASLVKIEEKKQELGSLERAQTQLADLKTEHKNRADQHFHARHRLQEEQIIADGFIKAIQESEQSIAANNEETNKLKRSYPLGLGRLLHWNKLTELNAKNKANTKTRAEAKDGQTTIFPLHELEAKLEHAKQALARAEQNVTEQTTKVSSIELLNKLTDQIKDIKARSDDLSKDFTNQDNDALLTPQTQQMVRTQFMTLEIASLLKEHEAKLDQILASDTPEQEHTVER
jgi:hypothetical protein